MATKLTEQEIRPAHLIFKQRIALLTDVGRMLTRCSEFVDVSCPACAWTDSKPRFSKNGMSYIECCQCNTLYVSPRPTPEVLEWFYRDSPNYAYWNEVIFPASEAMRRQKIFVPRVDRLIALCKKYSVTTTNLLEVGAGFGTFCSELKSRSLFDRVVAVEPTPELAKTCRARGIEVIEQPIESVEFQSDTKFDVVASFEVVEHLFAPLEFVRHIASFLGPGGLLVLTCPNGQGFDIETLGAASNSVDHEHLNYFNPASLASMLSTSGFEVLESFTPGRLDAELVRSAILSNQLDVATQPFLKRILIDDWGRLGDAFQDFLADHGLSSNLWVVARKR